MVNEGKKFVNVVIECPLSLNFMIKGNIYGVKILLIMPIKNLKLSTDMSIFNKTRKLTFSFQPSNLTFKIVIKSYG